MTSTEAVVDRASELGMGMIEDSIPIDLALPELATMLAASASSAAWDSDAVVAVVTALGDAWDERATALLLPLARSVPEDDEVRLAVTGVLYQGVGTEPLRTEVIELLLPRTADEMDQIRQGACFALGQMLADGPTVREALAARLEDADPDTAEAALVALAKTGDPRALTAVRNLLTLGITEHLLEAAAALSDPGLLAGLLAAEREGRVAKTEAEAFAFAVRRCNEASPVLADELEARLVEGVNAQLAPTGWSMAVHGSYPVTVGRLANPPGTPPLNPTFWPVWGSGDPLTVDLAEEISSWVSLVVER